MPPPAMPLSSPLLPAKFMAEVQANDSMHGFVSSVFEQSAHEDRLKMRNWSHPLSPNRPVGILNSKTFTMAAKRTMVHCYAVEGDVLALCELVGLGANPALADTYGTTPLHLVYMEMEKVKGPMCITGTSDGQPMSKEGKERLFYRLAWTARILIEQHVDINITIRGSTLVDLSCGWKDWETVTVLLRHGSKPSSGASSRLRTPADKKHFSELVKAHGTTGSRPPRVCPCWSGLGVPECHGREPQAYPLEYVCVCGSGKQYKRCCHKLGRFVIEMWDEPTGRINHDYESARAAAADLREKFHAIPRNTHVFDDTIEKMGRDAWVPDISGLMKPMTAFFLSQGLMDPAFAYAMERAGFVPQYASWIPDGPFAHSHALTCCVDRPQGRRTSHQMRKDMQGTWNKLVDEYIHLGDDARSVEDIERAAKISGGNGAYFRTCGGADCKKSEGRNVSFSYCAGCKIVSDRRLQIHLHLRLTRKIRPYTAVGLVRNRHG